MNSFLMEDNGFPYYIVHTISAEVLETQGTRASAAVVLNLLSQL